MTVAVPVVPFLLVKLAPLPFCIRDIRLDLVHPGWYRRCRVHSVLPLPVEAVPCGSHLQYAGATAGQGVRCWVSHIATAGAVSETAWFPYEPVARSTSDELVLGARRPHDQRGLGLSLVAGRLSPVACRLSPVAWWRESWANSSGSMP